MLSAFKEKPIENIVKQWLQSYRYLSIVINKGFIKISITQKLTIDFSYQNKKEGNWDWVTE